MQEGEGTIKSLSIRLATFQSPDCDLSQYCQKDCKTGVEMLRGEYQVKNCSWCPDHRLPDPLHHPNGQVTHITPHNTLESALENLECHSKVSYLLFNGELLKIHYEEIDLLRKLIASKVKR